MKSSTLLTPLKAVNEPEALPMSEEDYHSKRSFDSLCAFISSSGGSGGDRAGIGANARFQNGTVNKAWNLSVSLFLGDIISVPLTLSLSL
jgi:hypothetical protein